MNNQHKLYKMLSIRYPDAHISDLCVSWYPDEDKVCIYYKDFNVYISEYFNIYRLTIYKNNWIKDGIDWLSFNNLNSLLNIVDNYIPRGLF